MTRGCSDHPRKSEHDQSASVILGVRLAAKLTHHVQLNQLLHDLPHDQLADFTLDAVLSQLEQLHGGDGAKIHVLLHVDNYEDVGEQMSRELASAVSGWVAQRGHAPTHRLELHAAFSGMRPESLEGMSNCPTLQLGPLRQADVNKMVETWAQGLAATRHIVECEHFPHALGSLGNIPGLLAHAFKWLRFLEDEGQEELTRSPNDDLLLLLNSVRTLALLERSGSKSLYGSPRVDAAVLGRALCGTAAPLDDRLVVPGEARGPSLHELQSTGLVLEPVTNGDRALYRPVLPHLYLAPLLRTTPPPPLLDGECADVTATPGFDAFPYHMSALRILRNNVLYGQGLRRVKVGELYPGAFGPGDLLETEVELPLLHPRPLRVNDPWSITHHSVHRRGSDRHSIHVNGPGKPQADLDTCLVMNTPHGSPSADAWTWHAPDEREKGMAEGITYLPVDSMYKGEGEADTGAHRYLTIAQVAHEYLKLNTGRHEKFYHKGPFFLAIISNRPCERDVEWFKTQVQEVNRRVSSKRLLAGAQGVLVVCRENFPLYASSLYHHFGEPTFDLSTRPPPPPESCDSRHNHGGAGKVASGNAGGVAGDPRAYSTLAAAASRRKAAAAGGVSGCGAGVSAWHPGGAGARSIFSALASALLRRKVY